MLGGLREKSENTTEESRNKRTRKVLSFYIAKKKRDVDYKNTVKVLTILGEKVCFPYPISSLQLEK